jgi:hypothetical protein
MMMPSLKMPLPPPALTAPFPDMKPEFERIRVAAEIPAPVPPVMVPVLVMSAFVAVSGLLLTPPKLPEIFPEF